MPNLKFAASGLLAVGLLSGCGGSSSAPKAAASAPTAAAAAANVITVSKAACGTGWRHPAAGLQTLLIHNSSDTVVEVTLADADTGAVHARLEGIGPGTTRPMQVDVGSGRYAFECSGFYYGSQTGPVIRVGGHTPGGAAVVPPTVGELQAVLSQSRSYVANGLAALVSETAALAARIKAGDLPGARAAWLTAHLAYERLGSAYGMFGGYDDEIDGLPDGLPGGVNDPSFTGFYRLEYGLWHGQSAAELAGPAEQLDIDVQSLGTASSVGPTAPALVLSDLALRTHEILEHTMRFQLSGHDDFGSGTTLATAAANIDATQAQLSILHPLLVSRYASLPAVYAWLARLRQLIDAEHTSSGWTPVSRLSTAQRETIDAAAGQAVELLAPIPVMFESSPVT